MAHDQDLDNLSILHLLSKFSKKGETWNKKSLSRAVYWAKFFLGLALGAILGILRIQGSTGNMIYISIPILIQYYVSGYLEIDIESLLDNASAVLIEGLIPCYASFLLVWTLINTFFYQG